MGKHQLQHYLPQVYLAGFARPNGEVWRYDRVNGFLKPLGTPVTGAERDLYSLITGEQLSHEIETKWFKPLDGRFGTILRKLEKREDLSLADVLHLARFVAYLRVRTPAMIRETESRFQQFDALLGPDRESIKYHAGPPDQRPDTFVMSNGRSDNVSPQRASADRRNEVLTILINTGIWLAQVIVNLEWTMLIAPKERSFVVGDNPFAIVPPESHDVIGDGVGPMTPGAAVFIPLSSGICLRLTNSGKNPSVGNRRVMSSDVRAINSCQVLNSERYLFGQSDLLLKRLVTDIGSVGALNLAEIFLREGNHRL